MFSIAADGEDRRAFDSLYIFPGVYYSAPRGGLNARDDYGAQLTLGTPLGKYFDLEALSETRKWEPSAGGLRASERGASLQGLFKLLPQQSLTPFLSGGAGWVQSSYNGRHADVPLTRGGGGLIWSPLDIPLSLRGDASYRREYDNTATLPGAGKYPSDWIYTLGLSYRVNFVSSDASSARTPPTQFSSLPPQAISDESAVVPAAPEPPAAIVRVARPVRGCTVDPSGNRCLGPEDSDGDGVPDTEDRCPDTPPHAVVDADGCYLYMQSGG